MNAKRIFLTLFCFAISVSVFCQGKDKSKNIGHITVQLNFDKHCIYITDPDDKVSIPDKGSPDYKPETPVKKTESIKSVDSGKGIVKKAVVKSGQPLKTVDCTSVTVIHGENEKLLKIYDSINSIDDYKNLDKSSFSAAMGISVDENTGKVMRLNDFIIIDEDTLWED